MTEFNDNTLVAPVYRYYTVDLLSNTILAEVPFGDVSYERAIKSAGTFSGKIPVLATPSSRSWNLYKSTMPGKTGLYIMRDDQCVWGGIIWGRNYDLVGQTLSIDASEFTSYFHHRRIWKTWNHQYGATVISDGSNITVTFDTGTSVALTGGSSVKFEFNDVDTPASWLAFNGYYVIASDPEPTEDTFTVSGSVSTAEINSIERTNGITTVYTNGAHGFTTGNSVTINITKGSAQFNGTYQIVASSGSASSYFTFSDSRADYVIATMDGTATRPFPAGTYTDVTVSVRSDTYAYIRALVQSVFNDFTGIDFADSFIAPGERYQLDAAQKSIDSGWATIKTKTDHGLIAGQAVEVNNVGKEFNGTQVVYDTPHTNTFRFRAGGTMSPTNLASSSVNIIGRSAAKSVATITTSAAHHFEVGQTVSIYAGADIDGQVDFFNGDYEITRIPTSNTFQYQALSDMSVAYQALTQPTATVSGKPVRNIVSRAISSGHATLQTDQPHGFSTGQTVSVANLSMVVPIVGKALDQVNSLATLTTAIPHQFQVGDTVNITGIRDVSRVVKKDINGRAVTLTTSPAHNFSQGDKLNVSDIEDTYTVVNRAISGNVATITTSTGHNVKAGDSITVKNVNERQAVKYASIGNQIARITTTGIHYLNPNDRVTVSGVADVARVISKSASKQVVTLSTSKEHNFKVGQRVTYTGLGAPYDGTYAVIATTPTRIQYKIKSKAGHKTTKSNGTATVSTVGTTWFTFPTTGNDIVSADTTNAVITYSSAVNGTNMTVSSVSGNNILYPCVAATRTPGNVTQPTKAKDPKPSVSEDSIVNGTNYTITKITRNSVTYNLASTPTYQFNNVAVSPGSASVPSVFNGNNTITGATSTTFQFSQANKTNILETPVNDLSYARANNIFNGSYTITSTNAATNSFSYAVTHNDVISSGVSGYGLATVTPSVISSTFGPYPGNSDIDIEFSTQDYSGSNVTPTAYRGFELTNVGDALDSYSDSVDGFEYRINCTFDPDTDKFKRTFVLLPIDFPDPPGKGEVSPPSRFGADQLVFEYPGNITNLTIAESAENSATRFFATGDTELSADAGATVAVASATDLFDKPDGEKWPILDDDQKIDNINNKDILYSYAERYLIESRPPGVSLSVSVNGSLAPVVGAYSPGDWCSLIVNDEFIAQRLASDMEPRDNLLVRKIDSYKVTVPNGSTVPEKVDLSLVTESQVDSVGQ